MLQLAGDEAHCRVAAVRPGCAGSQCASPTRRRFPGEKIMDEQSHIVSGIYTTRAEAEAVRDQLVERGLPREQTNIVENAQVDGNRKMAQDNEALKDVLVDGSVGAVVGTVLGALSEVALVAANVTLFVASPLIAPLAMLGWGAVLGGVVGAAVGAEKTEEKSAGKLSELVLDAIRSGHVVLVTKTTTAAQAALVRQLIGDSVTQTG
jgi:hypothetical protein